jgi:xanthine/uracil/vitamin C permease (AzgA family)
LKNCAPSTTPQEEEEGSGCSNAGSIWKDPQEYLPTLMAIVLILFTFSFTDGVAFGFIVYVLLSTVPRQFRKVHWLMVLFPILFIVRYVALRGV